MQPGPGPGSPGRARRAMTERCSLWSALSAAACCFYRGSFMQVQVSGGGGGTRGRPGCPAQRPRGCRRAAAPCARRRGEGGGGTAGGRAPGARVDPRPRTGREAAPVPGLQRRRAGARGRRPPRGPTGEPRCSQRCPAQQGAGRAGCGQRACLRSSRR